ncbi:hypothetical protein J6590_036382, partial [Homalodisca vitripennis]
MVGGVHSLTRYNWSMLEQTLWPPPPTSKAIQSFEIFPRVTLSGSVLYSDLTNLEYPVIVEPSINVLLGPGVVTADNAKSQYENTITHHTSTDG